MNYLCEMVLVGQQGELALHINNSKVFIVSGYKGDDDLGYVSVQVDDAQLYHCGKNCVLIKKYQIKN